MAAAPSRGHAAENFVVSGGQVQIGDRNYYTSSLPQIPRFHNRYYEIPRNLSPVFTGREEICERLRASCLPSNSSDSQQQKRFVIYGLGGSGKTQLCLKFAEDHREKFWGIFWIDASSDGNIERGFSNIAKVCGLEGDLAVIRRWLSNVPESWMLILDNADDPDLDLSQYFPVGDRGTILITTRNPDCRIHATAGLHELGRMETEEATTLLLKTTGAQQLLDRPTRKTAKSVVLTLGCLALAIDQAGAVIRQGLYSMEEYCEIYSQRRKELLSQKPVQGGGDYRYTAYTTWEISLRMIEDKDGETARDAVELLQIFSFFHHDRISEEIFCQAWESLQKDTHSGWIRSHQPSLLQQQSATWDSRRIRRAMALLSSFSLISRDKNGLVSIHPLVHTWARDRLSGSDEQRIWTLAVCVMSASITWTYQTADYRFRKLLIPHIDACLGIYPDGVFHLRDVDQDYLSMAERFELAYRENGRRQEALQLTETVMAARKRTLSEEHPDTLRSMHCLALSYSETGRQQEALQLMEMVVAARKRTLGEEHLDTLRSMHSLALRYSKTGRRQEALQLTEMVVAVYKRMLGEEHPDTLSSIHNLALSYSETGRQQEALQLTETVVTAYKRTLGEEHPNTLSSMYNLALSYSETGRRQEALQLMETVVATRKRTLGEEHLDTLGSIHNLALSYSETGRRQEALQLTETVVTAYKRMLGEEHPDTLRSMYNLALRYSETGRRQEALQLTETVVAAYKRTLDEEHPDTLRSIHSLALRYSETGRQQKALQLMETVVAARKRTLGEEHLDTLRSMHSLALSYSETGRRQETLQLAETVVAVYKRTLGEEHPDTLRSMYNLALSYSETGR